MPDFFVIVGESKKICQCSKDELLDNILVKFGIPQSHAREIVFQTFSSTYNDWLDTEVTDLPDGGKVNVILKNSCVTADQNASTLLDQAPGTPETCEAVESSECWPSRFVLPIQNFGPLLLSSLKKKANLTPSMSRAIMDVLYSEMTKYTYYPTSSQYNEVIQTLMQHFPYLRKLTIGDVTVEGDSCVRKWKCALGDKFRNMRKRRDRLEPEVAAKSNRTQVASGASSSKKTKTINQWGVMNFLPDRPSTEDDVSIRRATEWLQAESVKRRPDWAAVKLRMQLTFADRRKMVVNQMTSIGEMKKEFPCLFHEEELLHEFQRLTEMNLDENFLAGIAKYGQAILDKASVDNPEKLRILEALSTSKIQEDRNRLTAYGSLLVLPSLLKEDQTHIVCQEQLKPDHVTTPLLLHEGDVLDGNTEYRLLVDDVEVAHPLDYIQGLECLLATYYIFNIAYPKCIVNTLTFLQKSIVGLTDKTTTPRKVVSLMLKLCK